MKKIKYIGHAPQLSILLPFGAPKSKATNRITFEKGQTAEVEDDIAEEIIKHDHKTVQRIDLSAEDIRLLNSGDPKVKQVSENEFLRATNFLLAGDEPKKVESSKEEGSSTEEPTLVKKKKKRGRPKKED